MSTLDIKFTPIVNEKKSNYFCYLCQIDSYNILLDCGWNYQMDTYIVDTLEKYGDGIDLILISGSSLQHVGSLAYIYTKNSWKCPIYMTNAVWQASKLTLYDYYQSLFNSTTTELPFSLDDVDNVFDSVIRVRYLQNIYLKGKGQGMTILALNSGMTLGSCMWRISKDNEGDIVYAVQINHKKQLHLNEAMLHGLIKPFIFITDASDRTEEPQHKKIKINKLTSEILAVLGSNNGSVLVFSDTAGQVLEFLFLLSNILRSNKYTCIDVILCSHVAHHVLKMVTSNTEWLNEKLMKRMETGVFNFLGLLNLYTCQTIQEIDHIKSAKIVITSNTNMEYVLGVELFSRMAGDPRNLIIFTIPPEKGSLAREIIDSTRSSEIQLEIHTRVQLEGQELVEAIDQIDQNIVNEVPHQPESHILSSDNEDDDQHIPIPYVESYQKSPPPSALPHDIKSVSSLDHDTLNDSNVPIKRKLPLNLNDTENFSIDFKAEKFSDYSLEYLLNIFDRNFSYVPPLNFNEVLKPMQNFVNTRLKKSFDVYGETYKHEGFVKNVIQEKNIISYDDKVMKTAYDHAEIDITKYPSKMVSTCQNVQINAQILFINLNCAIDSVSQTRMIESIQPQHLIVVSNNVDDATFLEESLDKTSENSFSSVNRHIIVHRVVSNETLNICDHKQVIYAKIKDNDIENLHFKRCSNVSIAWMEICDKYQSKNAFTDDYPIVKLSDSNNINKHNSIFINHVKINEFKVKLESEGISTLIDNGILYCADNKVKIFKTSSNHINVEALLCQDYFNIKKLLYDQFCLI